MKYSKHIQKIIIKTLVLPLSLIPSVALAQVSPNGKIKVEYVSPSEVGQLQVKYKGPQGWQSIMKMDICLGQGKIIHSKKAKSGLRDAFGQEEALHQCLLRKQLSPC